MHRFLIAAATLIAFCQALHLDENRPDTIPILSTEVTNETEDWFKMDPEYRLIYYSTLDPKSHMLVQELKSQISKLEENKPPGSPHHKLIKIKETIAQQVGAEQYCKVVFTVGQLSESPPRDQINEQGQYGKCYFKFHKPSGNGDVQLQEHACVKVLKNDAI